MSKLIYDEAFDVLYKENRVDFWFWYPPSPITRVPRVVDTIQNIETEIFLDTAFSDSKEPRTDVARFEKLMPFFGNHSIIRRNLGLLLHVGQTDPHSLKWLVGALGRFTNFRTITLQLSSYDYWAPHNDFSEWCERLKIALEPVLGYAEQFDVQEWTSSSIGLRFHPVDNRNQSREPDDGDCDYLNWDPSGFE
ncbi:hypothetical protein MMC22_001956 [Lobaria immixta]|nr:hypothetical protein [Lobaria immixta]